MKSGARVVRKPVKTAIKKRLPIRPGGPNFRPMPIKKMKSLGPNFRPMKKMKPVGPNFRTMPIKTIRPVGPNFRPMPIRPIKPRIPIKAVTRIAPRKRLGTRTNAWGTLSR